jgi:uncharacterized membrane protein
MAPIFSTAVRYGRPRASHATGLFVALLVLIQLGVLRYAYMRLGISSGAALFLLFASLIGSYFNIPVVYLPEQRVLAQQEGMPQILLK